jgi:hypothetical protein
MPYLYQNPILVKTPTCIHCDHIGIVKVDYKDYVEYTQTPRAERRFIQDIFFYKDKADREKNYMNHFRQAFKTGLFKENEPYMYMGEDKDKVYFKHGLTRQYKYLIKEVEVV